MRRVAIYLMMVAMSSLLLTACEPTVPSQYIQPDDMEDLLYDYFVSQGMAQQDFSEGSKVDYNRELYLDAVLKKHDVSRADFDSSLVYYYIRSDRFFKIYKRVQERLGEDAMLYGASASEVERFTVTSLTGDTANIWNGPRTALLVPYAPYNRLTFHVQADTAFRKGDTFMLNFVSEFLYQSGSKDALAFIAVKYANDSVASFNTHFSMSGNTQLRTSSDSEKDVKEVNGYIYLGQGYDATVNLRMFIIRDIQLVRFHKSKEVEVPDEDEESKSKSRLDSLQQVPDSLRHQRHRLGERPVPVTKTELNVPMNRH